MNHFYHFAIAIGIVGGGRVIVTADAMGHQNKMEEENGWHSVELMLG
jgi:hypothetical protein